MKYLRTALVLLGATLLQGGTTACAAPALWLVQGKHSKIYLFGTMHILPKPVPWLDGKIKDAFNQAGTLWEEADVGIGNPVAARDLMAQGMDPGTDLWSELPPESAKLFRAELDKCKISPELVANYRPWLAALMPTICDILAQSSAAAKAGSRADSSPEAILTNAARAGGKRLAYFETAAEQIGYLANSPHDAQLAQLRKAIAEAATGKDDFTGLENDWFNGNVAAIAKAVLAMRNDGEAFYQTIFTSRNSRFAARIKQMLDSNGTIFVAIGAGHLAGPDSVQAQLARQGITAQLQ